MFQPIRDERGSVIGFIEANEGRTNLYGADTTFAGWSDGANVYTHDGRQIADNPMGIGLLLGGAER